MLTEKLLVNLDPGLYFFINQGCLTVDNMDDKEEMQIVEVRFLSIISPRIHQGPQSKLGRALAVFSVAILALLS